MSDENTALDILQRQVESLTAQISTLTSERDEYRSALTEVADERDSLRSTAANPSEQSQRITELEAAARDRSHYDRFADLAKGAKAKESALKHLWKVAGYKAESDDIDEDALADLVDRLKEEADYAFDPDEHSNVTAAKEAARTRSGLEIRDDLGKPAGGGRAGRNNGRDGTIITADMRADPKFMLNPKNAQIIKDAAENHRFR